MLIIVLFIIFLVALLVLGLLLKKIGGWIAIAVPIALLAIVIALGVWIMMDASSLQNHFYQDDKLFVLDIDGNAAGAFVLGKSGIPVPVGDLSSIRVMYPDLAFIKGNYYKVIVLDWSVVQGDIDVLNFKASADEIKSALLSKDPRQLFIEKTSKAFGGGMIADLAAQVVALYPTNDFFASSMFAILAEEPLLNQDFIFAGIRQGTVIVYPETAVFKIIKLLPEDLARILIPVKA
jgi:hypothetical protein